MNEFTIPTTAAIRDIVRDEVNTALEKFKTDLENKSKYMTRQQVADHLNITLSTVHSYMNQGILTAYKVNGRTLFKVYEVDEALQKLTR